MLNALYRILCGFVIAAGACAIVLMLISLTDFVGQNWSVTARSRDGVPIKMTGTITGEFKCPRGRERLQQAAHASVWQLSVDEARHQSSGLGTQINQALQECDCRVKIDVTRVELPGAP